MMGVSRLSSIKSPLSELFIYLDEIYTYVRSSLCLPSLGFWPLAADPAYLMPVAEGYTSKRSHLIDLETLSWSDSLLTKTLSHMREVRQDYAVASEVPYQTAFNWDDLFKTLQNLAEQEGCTWPEQRRYHIIAFYSQLHPEMGAATDSNNLLYRLDEAAFEEAMQNGGLLKYWFGKPDEKHRNLATCVWRSKKEANEIRFCPCHMKAKSEGSPMYRNILIKELELVIDEGLSDYSIEWKRDMPVKISKD